MIFWSCILEPGERKFVDVQAPEGAVLHIKRAILGKSKPGKTYLKVINGEGDYAIACLQESRVEYASLNTSFLAGTCGLVNSGMGELCLIGYIALDAASERFNMLDEYMLASLRLPSSFQTPFGDSNAITEPCPACVELRLVCACGVCSFVMPIACGAARAVRCCCTGCRRFHAAPFAAWISVDCNGTVQKMLASLRSETQVWRDRCEHLGDVERFFCASCGGILATACPSADPSIDVRAAVLFLCLGVVADASIPLALGVKWRSAEIWCAESSGPLWHATPKKQLNDYSLLPRPASRARGGCACGGCTFEAEVFPGELQHCYCNLCRQFSGSVGQTWMGCRESKFKWTVRDKLIFRRTSNKGCRHACSRCGTTMTIVYDVEPHIIWPAAGALDDDSLPLNVSTELFRVIHICCDWMPPWYVLPEDGLPRLRFAGG